MFERSPRFSFFSWTLPLLFALCISARGGEGPSEGSKLYQTHCAECHGRSGQGVHGKYDEALHGDWSLERLIRYIDNNMPEDDPEQCTGEDAASVGRYIFDAFYSPEAHSRNNPARVELVRMTNRQYVNTVADLVKHFTGADSARGEAGLQATYYNSRNFEGEKKILERVDARIDFDFGSDNPTKEHAYTNGFSMQWRGSLQAMETGNYEFVVKTPNGVRLWINDDEEPVIDAWVSSGDLREHKASLRLIGGRVYPVRLDYFKFNEKLAAISLQWKPPHGALEIIPKKNLQTGRSTPTRAIITPFPADDSSVGYERGVAVSKAWDEATTSTAIEVANYVAANLNRLSRSKPDDTNRAARVQAFCEQFVTTAFRRPLTEEQKRGFVNDRFKDAKTLEDAVKRVVLLTLKSPRFLYLGLQSSPADGFTVAERLSFGLWDSLPDKELIKAAEANRLKTHDEVLQQANRMLTDPRAQSKMLDFFHHWLQMDRVEDLSKDATLYPGFTPEIIADLRTSLDMFLTDTMWNGASDYRTLLQADHMFLNRRLAEFYAIPGEASDEFAKAVLNSKERSGVLTHPYLLAALSYPKSTSPIHRGVFLTRNIVGRTLKPPPEAVAFKDADFQPHLTMREKVSELTSSKACQTCHSVINPLGFSLENYDAVGRFRTLERDRPVDASSDYPTDDGHTVRLTGARDVANFAISSEQAQNGFIQQLFHQIVKQPMAAYGANTVNELREAFVRSEFNLKQLMVEIAAKSALQDVGMEMSRNDNSKTP